MNSVLASPLPLPQELDFLQLRYRSDTGTLVARWQRPVSPDELRQGYAATLQAAEAAACPFWLVDLRGRNTPAEAEAYWLVTEFLPQLPARLGSSVWLGFLLSPSFGQLLTLPLAPTANLQCTTRYSDNEGVLAEWLAQCQAQHAGSATH